MFGAVGFVVLYNIYSIQSSPMPYIFVWAKVLLQFFGDLQGPYTTDTISTHFAPSVVLLVAFGYGATKIPALVHGLFSGHSGVAAYPTLWRS